MLIDTRCGKDDLSRVCVFGSEELFFPYRDRDIIPSTST